MEAACCGDNGSTEAGRESKAWKEGHVCVGRISSRVAARASSIGRWQQGV